MNLKYILLSTYENRVRAGENLKEKTLFFFQQFKLNKCHVVIKYRHRRDFVQYIVGMHLQTSQGPTIG